MFVLIGCGSGGSSGLSGKEIAIAKITGYATGNSNTEPTVGDYHDAGIMSVTSSNIDKMNNYIKIIGSSDIEDWKKDSDGDGIIDGIDSQPNDPENKVEIIHISDDYHVGQLGKSGNIQKMIKIGTTPKSLYVLLSNYHKSQNSNPTISHNAKIVQSTKKKLTTIQNNQRPKIFHAPSRISKFNRDASKLIKRYQNKSSKVFQTIPERRNDTVGNTKIFYLESDTSRHTTATARKIVSNISTVHGSKTLNVWVSNDSFGAGCSKAKCVTQQMVDSLADTFLKTGNDNDIYDWVTNIFGEEWGANAKIKFSNLISENNEVTILVTDIDNDNRADGGIIGYFYGKDNYIDTSGSNKRIMFYIDSVMFANEEDGDYWQKEIYSTLAHEFVHMIEFYQKMVLKDTGHDVWIAEMIAEATEDLIATKIRHAGPRGVEHTDGSAGSVGNIQGRYSLFNQDGTSSLTAWNNNLSDYSKVNAFGTFLTRNYGGAKVLRDIMHNSKKHEDAIIYATQKSVHGTGKNFDDLLREWGIAILLSDNENLQNIPTYNTGDFTENAYGNSTYQLGSINFFNYDPPPSIKTIQGTVKAQGNYYYKIGEDLTGDININLTLSSDTEATLIVK